VYDRASAAALNVPVRATSWNTLSRARFIRRI
jgi:hypothetical protein